MLLRRLELELPRYAYARTDENVFQQGLALVLTELGIAFTREHVAGERDRFDFLCEGGLVIEAKIKGSFSEAIRQIDRYCQRGDVAAVVLVTTCAWGSTMLLRGKPELHGKPVRLVCVHGQAF